MIIDKIENVSTYKNIPDYAVDFIKRLSKDIQKGRYSLNNTDYANIESYTTKSVSDAKFEAHNKFIDIQILLEGTENIFYTDRAKLTEANPFDTEKDIVFYKENVAQSNYVTLDGTNFAMIFPHEAHAPQVQHNNQAQTVKKVVLKIKL